MLFYTFQNEEFYMDSRETSESATSGKMQSRQVRDTQRG